MRETALVTGASSGIGEQFAHQLAARGHALVLVARRAERLERLAAELPTDAHVIPCDLAADAASLPERVAELGVEVELLVNNAGFGTAGPFVEQDPGRDAEQVRLNCEAIVTLTHAFLPSMVERGRGGIINVASTAGMQPIPYESVYAATKAFAISFTDALHTELRGSGVRVLAVNPGPVPTEWQQVAGYEPGRVGASAAAAIPWRSPHPPPALGAVQVQHAVRLAVADRPQDDRLGLVGPAWGQACRTSPDAPRPRRGPAKPERRSGQVQPASRRVADRRGGDGGGDGADRDRRRSGRWRRCPTRGRRRRRRRRPSGPGRPRGRRRRSPSSPPARRPPCRAPRRSSRRRASCCAPRASSSRAAPPSPRSRSAVDRASPSSPRGPASTRPSSPITSPNALTTASAATVSPRPLRAAA